MRSIVSTWTWIGALALSGATSAQTTDRSISARVGYFVGQGFNGVSAQRIRLEGLSFGIDLPIFDLSPRTTVSFSPSGMFGGALQHGKDSDGNLYRMLLTARLRQPASTTYYVVGAGLGFAHDRGITRIRNKSGFVGQLGVGFDLGDRKMYGGRPFVEFSYHGGSTTFRGMQLDLGLKF